MPPWPICASKPTRSRQRTMRWRTPKMGAMRMDKLVMTIKPTFHTTRVLMTCGDDEVFKAVLPAPSQAHWRAASTLQEGMSLWFGRKISVVLCVDGKDSPPALNLCDGLGFGSKTLHYEVEVIEAGRRRRGKRINGVGSFRDLRQLCLQGVR